MMKFGEIILWSKNPELLASFLSFIFDVPSQLNSEGLIGIELDGISFLLKSSDKKRFVNHQSFTFTVDSASELHDLEQKVEFFFYKNSLQAKKPQLEDDCLVFYDTDQREWTISIAPQVTAVNHPKSNRENVRYCKLQTH